MPFKSKGNRWWWSTLLIFTAAAFVCLIHIFISHTDLQAEKTGYRKLNSVPEKLTAEKCVPVCSTKECVVFANYLNQKLKPTADPCENFHTFTCGSYEERFAEDEARHIFFDTEIKMYKILNNIINDIQADPESALGKLKTLYNSCINYASSENTALLTARKFLDEIGIPDWPNLPSDFQFLNTDIPTILGNLEARGEVLFLMLILPYVDYTKVKDTIGVRIDGRYFNNLLKPPPKEAIVHILEYFELNSDSIEVIWNDYNTIGDSLLELLNENCRDLPLSCQMYGDDNAWFDYVSTDGKCTSFKVNCSNQDGNWTSICKTFQIFLNASDSNGQLNKDILIIEDGDDHFVKNIFPVLDSFSHRAVANYLAMNFYLDHLEELNFYFQQTKQRYFYRNRCDDVWRPKVLSPRWEICTQWISKHMPLPLQLEYIIKYLTLQEMEKISDLFEECKSAIVNITRRQMWIAEEDEKEFMNKLEDIFLLLDSLIRDFTPEVFEQGIMEKLMNDYYAQFRPTKINFFHNALELRRTISDVHKLASHFALSFDRYKFKVQASAYAYGVFEMHLGLLLPPYYVPGLPRLLNLLLFGGIAGHEIGHMIQMFLDETITHQEIKNKENCLIKQYSNMKYEILDEKLNGSQYASENFADGVATEMLDRFIEKYISEEEDFLVPGFPYSSKEMLYIAAYVNWCSKTSEAEELHFKEMEVHSPYRFRIIGPLQNSRGFSETFNCSVGSYMNPPAKCSIMS